MARKPKKDADTASDNQDDAGAAEAASEAADTTAGDAAEGAPDEAAAAEAQQGSPITINAQYIKDLSFEAPNTPGVFGTLRNTAPDINVNIDVNAQPLDDNVYEVVLDIAANCNAGDQTAFILELSYGGLFTLNVPQEHLQAILLIECPRLLFPFARNILSDSSRDGGFPPLMLGPVDFVAMYQAQLQQQQQAQDTGGGAEA